MEYYAGPQNHSPGEQVSGTLPPPLHPFFPARKKEWFFAAGILVSSLLLVNCVLFGGFRLGFAIATVAVVLVMAAYLIASGCRPDLYSGALLALSVVIAVGFARSNDGAVKFVMLGFLFVAENLGLCLLAGKNRRKAGGMLSLLDAFYSAFTLGLTKLPEAFRGLQRGIRESGKVGKTGTAILVGLAVAAPILAVVLALLISADAAFSGLVALLPELALGEIVVTLLFGTAGACWLYTQGTALRHHPKAEVRRRTFKGVNALTVNTVLTGICLVYGVYLLSQMAYFVGGLSGILPEGFTMAEYARRGFFEMAWLCGINLAVIGFAVALVEKQGRAPLTTRLLCLFIGLMTLFFVVSASAKMGMYIGSYGLTRLRVLTQTVMIFLGICTALVCLWLFLPEFAYMKAILILGLVMGSAVLWADVDTVVAGYNVTAYQSGTLESVDVEYLTTLSDGAIPYIAALTWDEDQEVAQAAWAALENVDPQRWEDFRDWNYAGWIVEKILQ